MDETLPALVNDRWPSEAIAPLVRAYRLNGEEWSGPIAAGIAGRSVANWLDSLDDSLPSLADLRGTATAMRGFFLADNIHFGRAL